MMQEMNMKNKRVAKWDNLKFYMILCVVLGHTVYHFLGVTEWAKSIYLFIYTFHMPVFIFVAGLFSKHIVRERRFEQVIEYLFIYIVMKFLETLTKYLETGKLTYRFMWENGPAWFALAMAVFLLLTILIQSYNRTYVMLIALLVGCLAGLDPHFGDHFASMRICVFYPVFLAGYYMERSVFEEESSSRGEAGEKRPISMATLSLPQKLVVKLCGLLVLLICLIVCVQELKTLYPFLKLLKGKFAYGKMGFGLEGILIRLLCYVFWALMICAVIVLCSGHERCSTWLGQRTMAIFIWHSLMIELIFGVFHGTAWFKTNLPHYYLPAAMCAAVVIAIVTAYLPQLRIGEKLRVQEEVTSVSMTEQFLTTEAEEQSTSGRRDHNSVDKRK